MLTISHHPEALTELIEAAKYYNRQAPGLGAAFLEEFETAVGNLLHGPQIFAVRADGCRRCPIARFPHRIVYRIEGEQIRVYAVAHPSRRPGYWLERVS